MTAEIFIFLVELLFILHSSTRQIIYIAGEYMAHANDTQDLSNRFFFTEVP